MVIAAEGRTSKQLLRWNVYASTSFLSPFCSGFLNLSAKAEADVVGLGTFVTSNWPCFTVVFFTSPDGNFTNTVFGKLQNFQIVLIYKCVRMCKLDIGHRPPNNF